MIIKVLFVLTLSFTSFTFGDVVSHNLTAVDLVTFNGLKTTLYMWLHNFTNEFVDLGMGSITVMPNFKVEYVATGGGQISDISWKKPLTIATTSGVISCYNAAFIYKTCMVAGALAMQTKLSCYLASGTTIVSTSVAANALYSLLSLASITVIITVSLGALLICAVAFPLSTSVAVAAGNTGYLV